LPLRKGSAAVQKPPQAISVEAGGSILSQRPKGYNRSPGTSQPNARFLSALLEDQGKYAEAEPLYRRPIEIFQATLGTDHSNTVMVKRNSESLRQLNDQKSGKSAR
jgi:hypothetical protein